MQKAKKTRVVEKLPLRIIVANPPPGILWALQLGHADMEKPVTVSNSRIVFEFAVDVVPDATVVGFHLGGRAVQGPLGQRFVYLRIGAYAGQVDTPIARRAKISLEGINKKLLASAKAKRGGTLEVQFAGTDSKGDPACASVPLLGKGWNVA